MNLVVLLDTNIWVSGLQFARPDAMPTRALKKAAKEDTIATCGEIEAEILRILTQKFGWDREGVQAVLRTTMRQPRTVHLNGSVKACRDPKDDMFLECAVRAEADLLVAGDKDLLVLGNYENTKIITPAQYVLSDY